MCSYLCSFFKQNVIQQNTHLDEQEGKYGAVFLTYDFFGLKMKLHSILMHIKTLFSILVSLIINLHKNCVSQNEKIKKLIGNKEKRKSKRLETYGVFFRVGIVYWKLFFMSYLFKLFEHLMAIILIDSLINSIPEYYILFRCYSILIPRFASNFRISTLNVL